MCEDDNRDEKKHLIQMYKMLENDLQKISEYVHFHSDNLNTYSLRFYNLLFLSCNVEF